VVEDKDLVTVMKWHLSSVESLLSLYQHDLKNKLAILSGQAQLLDRLLKGGSSARMSPAELLQKMLVAVDSMNSMLGTLGKSGLEFGSEESKIWSVKLLVQEAWTSAEKQHRSASLFSLTNEVPDSVVVKLPRSPVVYALLQLLRNSVQHCRSQKERWIRVSAEQGKGFWIVRVVDSGNGVDPLVVPLMFTPFVSHPKGLGHLGLGLATSRVLLAPLGASVEYLDSQPHTTFELRLPS
jgi:two-component system OmpR family sensor kinase